MKSKLLSLVLLPVFLSSMNCQARIAANSDQTNFPLLFSGTYTWLASAATAPPVK